MKQDLEQTLHHALKNLPPRRAPGTLEARVLAELARRAALPWWRLSFAHWPAAPRAAFVLLCVGLVAGTFLGGVSAFVGNGTLTQAAAMFLAWAQPLLAVISSAGGLIALLLRVIPPLWIYAGLALGVVSYVALFGLGAAAYRTLYLRPSTAGDSL